MNIRQQKVASTIRRLVCDQFARADFADPRVNGLITVTRVEVTPDLKLARVYVSIFGQKGTVETVMQGLHSATRHIQRDVNPGLAMRVAPHLEFRLDDSLKKEAELIKKINDLHVVQSNDSASPLEGKMAHE